jgi:adenylate cyclase
MQSTYRFDDVEVFCRERRITVRGQPAAVGARAYDLLVTLIERADRVVGKEELMAVVWPDVVVEEANIAVQVSALRKLLGAQALATVPGRGYRFARPLLGDVAAAAPATQAPREAAEATAPPLPDKPAIAVLPFANLSVDREHRFFSDGVTQDIVTGLSRFRALVVIAHGSSSAYADRTVGIDTVAAQLGVRYIVDGSVQREGQRVRVTAQLIDALTRRHIWSDQYDRVLEDIFAVQEELTRSIVVAVAPEVSRAELQGASRRRPASLGAYQLALQARAMEGRAYAAADTTALPAVLEAVTRALAIDPKCSLALQTLGAVHWQRLFFRSAPNLVEAWEEAMRWARLAIEADDTDSQGYVLRAMVLQHDPRDDGRSIPYDEALHDLDIAARLNPNDFGVLRLRGLTEAVAGRPAEGIGNLNQALRVGPGDPGVLSHLSLAHFLAGSYSEGLRCAAQALAKRPKAANTLMFVAMNGVGAGDIEKAKSAWQAAHALAPGYIDARTNGFSVYRLERDRLRQKVFLRIAAGLEDPAASEGLR